MSIAPVIIDLLVKGAPQVHQAFKGVQDSAARAERAMQRDAERAAKAREAATKRERTERERAYGGMFSEIEKKERKTAAIRERSASMAGKHAAKEAAREVKAVEKAESDKVRAVERAERAKRAIRERSATMAGQYAAQEVAREVSASAQRARNAQRDAREAGRQRARFASAVVGAGAQGVMAGAGRAGNMAIGLATTAAQLGGGFSIADSVMGQSNLQKQAAALSASTQMAGADKRKIGSDEIYSKAKAIGTRQGIDPADVLRGFDEIKKLTGDLDQSMRVMPGVARLATATGGDLGEMSGLAANILAATPGMKDDELEKQMRVFTRQGVVGGVEVADFAKHGARLTAGASLFGGDKDKNLASMGAIAQISRQYGGASSAAEASLASQRFATDVAKHSQGLKAHGIDVSDKHGNLRDAQSILADMVTKTGGDVTKLGDMGLGERGVRALTGVSAIYKNAGGGKAGEKAVKDEFAKYTTGVTEDEVSAAEKTVMGAPDKQMFAVMEELRRAVGEALLPEFLKLVPVIKESIPAFVNLLRTGVPAFIKLIESVANFANAHQGMIQSIAANPVGSLIAFEVTKSFAAAGLPALLQALMRGAFGGGGGAAGGGAARAAGAGAPFGAVAAGGIAQAGLLYNIYGETSGAMSEGREEGMRLLPGLSKGNPAAMAAMADAQNKSGGARQAAAWGDRASKALGALVNPVGAGLGYAFEKGSEALGMGSAGAQARETIKAAEMVDTVELQRVTTQAIANGVREGIAQGNSGPNGAGRSEPIISR